MEVREPSAKYITQPPRVLTSAGKLPEDWHVQPLGDLMRLLNGRAFSPAEWSDSGIPIIRIQNLNDLDSEFNFYSGAPDERHIIHAGDLLFAWSGTTGSSFGARVWAGPVGVLNQHIFKVIPDPRKLSAAYAYRLLLKAQHAIERQAHGFKASFVHVKKSDLITVHAGFPPTLAEQDQISGALTDADALIDSLEQLLTKKRQIKQGAMQELFTGKRRLPGFSGPWKEGPLDQVISELVAGVSVNSDLHAAGNDVPSVVKTSAMKGGVFDPSECKPIIHADLARATTPLRKDTLLISRMNTPDLVGEVGYVDRDHDCLYLPDRIWMTRMRSPGCVCVRWLGYLLSSASYKRRIGDVATGTSGSMKNIAKGALLDIPVSYPEVDEQTAIANVLSDMDADITALESRLAKARDLKQAMAQALLSGRIRLVGPAA